VRVSVATGAIETVGEFPNGYITRFDCDVGRNGTALTCRVEDAVSDAWLIQNFDPDAVRARPAS
jgi:hypothetical protein